MTTRVTLELEFDIDFDYQAGSPARWDDPGEGDTVTITAVCIGAHRIPLSCFSTCDTEAIEEAAFEQARDYCPILDRH